MRTHHLSNFEIQTYYQNEPIYNDVYSRNNLIKIKDGTYVINLDEFKSIGTHWTTFYANNKNVTYFDSVAFEHIPKEIKNFAENKNIITNICRIQVCDSIMCGYFRIGFIDLILKG